MNVAKETAQRVLLEHGCTELPVKVGPICRTMGVTAKVYDNPKSNKYMGISIVVDAKPYVLLSLAYSEESQRFTAAHELGHILLGHVGSWHSTRADGTEYVVQGVRRPDIESEANVFAGELVAPECVLMLCGVETAEEVAELCEIIAEDAAPVAERIRQRRQSGKPFTQTELQIVQRFAGYIQRTCAVTC